MPVIQGNSSIVMMMSSMFVKLEPRHHKGEIGLRLSWILGSLFESIRSKKKDHQKWWSCM